MNLVGQWNKDKTQCWVVLMNLMDPPKYHAQLLKPDGSILQTMPWRDTMEEAQRDIPND